MVCWGQRKKHTMGGARCKPGKVGCGALGCYAKEVDCFLWAKQTCEDTEGHDWIKFYEDNWWGGCDSSDESLQGERGQLGDLCSGQSGK